MTAIDLYAPFEAVLPDGTALDVRRDHRCWPNQVSGEYCAHVRMPGEDRETEFWYDEEGKALAAGSPVLRNVQAVVTSVRLKEAFMAGCDDDPDAETRFEHWFRQQPEFLAETVE